MLQTSTRNGTVQEKEVISDTEKRIEVNVFLANSLVLINFKEKVIDSVLPEEDSVSVLDNRIV